MWSLGVMLYAMLVGAHAFFGNNEKVRRKILAAEYTIPDDVELSREAIALIGRLLTLDRFMRATIEEVCRHDWLTC